MDFGADCFVSARVSTYYFGSISAGPFRRGNSRPEAGIPQRWRGYKIWTFFAQIDPHLLRMRVGSVFYQVWTKNDLPYYAASKHAITL